MSTNLKIAAFVLGAVSLFTANQASSAEVCDGSVQTNRRGTTRQCYYLPTVSDGRVTGLQKHVNYDANIPHGGYGGGYGGGGYYGPHRR